jgi:hypothetical protein
VQNRAESLGTLTESANSTLRAQTSNHYISRTGIRMRSAAYASLRQDTDYTGAGIGRSSWGQVIDEGPAVMSLMCVEAICRTFPSRRAPLVLKGLFCGYNDLQGGFEGLWNTWLGAGIGIGSFSVVWSGVCRDVLP